MRGILIQEEILEVENSLKTFERNTGCELLLVIAKSSDEYPGASWRFGILTSFIVTFIFSLFFEFEHSSLWPLLSIILTFVFVWIGHYSWAKKFALSDLEVNRECQEKSFEYFHTLGTSKVSHKVTAMIMVSVLERKILVLVDEILKSKITQSELDELINIMQIHFRPGNMSLGLIKSIESLESKILNNFEGKVSEINPSELSDQIHFL